MTPGEYPAALRNPGGLGVPTASVVQDLGCRSFFGSVGNVGGGGD